MRNHMELSYAIILPQTRGVDMGGGGPTTYVVSFPRVLKTMDCLVPGFLAVAQSQETVVKFHVSALPVKGEIITRG